MARDPCENVMVAGLWIRCRSGGLQLLEGRRGLLLAVLCWTNAPWRWGELRTRKLEISFELIKKKKDEINILFCEQT